MRSITILQFIAGPELSQFNIYYNLQSLWSSAFRDSKIYLITSRIFLFCNAQFSNSELVRWLLTLRPRQILWYLDCMVIRCLSPERNYGVLMLFNENTFLTVCSFLIEQKYTMLLLLLLNAHYFKYIFPDTPSKMYFVHTVAWVLHLFGLFFILAAHEHYSIDV